MRQFFAGATYKDLYDNTSFAGRAAYCYDLCHPANMLITSIQVERAQQLLKRPAAASDPELWGAARTVAVAGDRATGGALAWYFRVSSWAYVGTVPVLGLLSTARYRPESAALFTFFHWMNQTHVAGMCYMNSGHRGGESLQRLLQGYAGAMVTAVGIVLAYRHASTRSAFLRRYSRFAPLPAAAAANTANTILVRSAELENGIPVRAGEPDQQVGVSRMAAAYAVGQTTVTRWVLPMGNFVLAPVVLMGIERTGLFRAVPKAAFPMQALVTVASFAFTFPITIALFPEVITLKAADLEPEISERVPAGGTVFFNKGL